MGLFRKSSGGPKTKDTIDALWRLEKIILDTLDFKTVVQKIVDSVLHELGYLRLGYRIVVLALVDEQKGYLKRISISQTEEAKRALQVTPVPFHEIDIPLHSENNVCIKAVKENKSLVTHNWVDILCPPYTPEEAKQVQAVVGIKTSMVYPVISKNKPIGVIIFSMVKDEKDVSQAEQDLIRGFTDIVGLAVQNAELYSSLDERTRQLDLANERLKELDKLKDDFVSVASHELRTPMTAIKSYLWMALHKTKQELSPNLAKYLDRSYVSVERLISLVNDMLNISRIEGGRIALNLNETDLLGLANEVKEEVGARATEKHITVTVEQAKLPKVLCDKDKIHQVYLNLVGNSLKFTPENGKITLHFAIKDQFVEISVTDTGHGIAQEDLPRLFAKFGRLDNSYVAMAESSGTGLGLYISKSLIQLHKGEIFGTSKGIGKGSTFSFTLPIVGTEKASQLAKEAPKETNESKGLEPVSLAL